MDQTSTRATIAALLLSMQSPLLTLGNPASITGWAIT
jgi:hypothetical protein